MVLPGISGSSLLMSCGLYLPVIAAMKDLLHFEFGQFWLVRVVIQNFLKKPVISTVFKADE